MTATLEKGQEMDTLESLKALIAPAEAAAERDRIKKAQAEATATMAAARATLEEAGRAFAKAQNEIGDPDEVREEELRELAEAREKSEQYESYIEADKAVVKEMLEKAEKEINTKWEINQSILHEAEGVLIEARAAMDEAATALDKIVENARQRDMLDAIQEGIDVACTSPFALIVELDNEIATGEKEFDAWSKEERHAMLTIWAGRARKLQDELCLNEEEEERIRGVFGGINRISNNYRPGFVDALNRKFVADWDAYISTAELKLLEASEERKKKLAEEAKTRAQARAEHERKQQARERASSMFVELERLCGSAPDDDPLNPSDPEKTNERIRGIVEVLLEDVGIEPSDETLLELIYDHKDIFAEGSSFRSLRRQFEKHNGVTVADFEHQFALAVGVLKGKCGILIGGSPREERRVKLSKLFQVRNLEWETSSPNMHQTVVNRITTGKYDFVIELVEFSGHDAERVKHACSDHGVQFFRVTKGYGASRIASVIESMI